MVDQIIINEKASFDDFGASVAKRGKKQPKKKTIKETVPFSNVTHDFTAINGEIYWEEGELQYIFEMIAPTPEKLEEMKTAFSGWLMNIISQKLYDPIVPDYHYLVTYADMSFDDEEGLEKTTATVSFTAYPYKIANYPKLLTFEIPLNSYDTAMVLNESSHRVTPKITTDQPVQISFNEVQYYVQAGTTEDEALKIEAGINSVTVNNQGTADCIVSFSFFEEVAF